jgi:hypothetical protein
MPMLQELIDELPDDGGAIPLPLVREIMASHDLPQWDRKAQYWAVKAGVIHPLPGRVGDQHALAVDHDQAVKVLVAAVLAFIAGCALVVALKMIDGASLDVNALVKSIDKT